jgi:hypothetical protein
MIRGLLILGASAYVLIASRSRHASVRALPSGPAYPVDLVALDAAILARIEGGESDPGAISSAVLRELYPETWEGVVVSWPVPASAPANLLALQERVKTRVRYVLAVVAEEDAEGVYP